MANVSIAATGTLVQRKSLGAGSYATIGELRDITPPTLTRNTIETTSHNEAEESFVPSGIFRKGEAQFTIGFVPTLATHDHTTGLTKSIRNKDLDWFKIIYPNGTFWEFSGYVVAVNPNAPIEGDGLTATITLRPTGYMTIT